MSLNDSSFLRRALAADAAISGVTGLLLIVGAAALQGMLGVPASLLRAAGLLLVPFVALVAYVATRRRLPRAGVRLVIALNAAWVAASVLVLFAVAPTAFGYAFIIAQALAVAVFAEVQYVGLRRITVAAA